PTVSGTRYSRPCRDRTSAMASRSRWPCLDRSALRETHSLPPSTLEQLAPLLLVPLAAAGEHEHQEVEPLRAVGVVAGPDHGLVDQQPRVRGCGRTHRAQDPRSVFVGPVVEDPREEVGVALRDRVEEAAGHELDAVAEGRLVSHRLGQVEDDPAQLWAPPDQLDEQRAVAAADVHDDLALAPLETREP